MMTRRVNARRGKGVFFLAILLTTGCADTVAAQYPDLALCAEGEVGACMAMADRLVANEEVEPERFDDRDKRREDQNRADIFFGMACEGGAAKACLELSKREKLRDWTRTT